MLTLRVSDSLTIFKAAAPKACLGAVVVVQDWKLLVAAELIFAKVLAEVDLQ